MRVIRKFASQDAGATAVEYAVMLALIIVTCVAAIGALGDGARLMWNDNDQKLNSAW
ncbi:MAG: Flp family type IVb pilin [Planctomyces sp.]|nr:Flp family type IVb pilin [Planctomyces sp.]